MNTPTINAMSGYFGFNTMSVNGHKGKKTLHILIDLGRTYNFLDEHLVRKLGCKLKPIVKQSVVIVDGNTFAVPIYLQKFQMNFAWY